MGKEKIVPLVNQAPPRVIFRASKDKRRPESKKAHVIFADVQRKPSTVRAPVPSTSGTSHQETFDPGVGPEEALLALNDWELPRTGGKVSHYIAAKI